MSALGPPRGYPKPDRGWRALGRTGCLVTVMTAVAVPLVWLSLEKRDAGQEADRLAYASKNTITRAAADGQLTEAERRYAVGRTASVTGFMYRPQRQGENLRVVIEYRSDWGIPFVVGGVVARCYQYTINTSAPFIADVKMATLAECPKGH